MRIHEFFAFLASGFYLIVKAVGDAVISQWGFLIAILFALVLDPITGIAAAKKKGVPIKSNYTLKGFFKKSWHYLVLLSFLSVVEASVTQSWDLQATRYIFISIILSLETISILENMVIAGWLPKRAADIYLKLTAFDKFDKKE